MLAKKLYFWRELVFIVISSVSCHPCFLIILIISRLLDILKIIHNLLVDVDGIHLLYLL